MDACICSVAWEFGPHRKNFFRNILRVALSEEQLTAVNGQFGSPTPTPAIAASVVALIERWRRGAKPPFGTCHIAGYEAVSWYGLAQAVFGVAKEVAPAWPQPTLVPIGTDHWPTHARRPASSRLNCDRAASRLGIQPMAWRPRLRTIAPAILDDLSSGTGRPRP